MAWNKGKDKKIEAEELQKEEQGKEQTQNEKDKGINKKASGKEAADNSSMENKAEEARKANDTTTELQIVHNKEEQKDTEKKLIGQKAANQKSWKQSLLHRAAIAAGAILCLALIICIIVGVSQYNKRMTIIAPIGDITFLDKYQQDGEYYVTFQAAEYNRIPSEMNDKGINIKVEAEAYQLLVLNEKYDSASVVFEVPQGMAKKAGYSQEELNIQTLWTEEIISKYTELKTIIWSNEY